MTGASRPAAAALLELPDDGAWENSEETSAEANLSGGEAPFIEIGGPGGAVFSADLGAAAPPRALGEIRADLKLQTKLDTPTGSFPRLAPTAPAHLSVRFHDVGLCDLKRKSEGPDPSLVTFHLPKHAVSGEYRVIRDEIRKQLSEAPSHILLFTSAVSESGTTTVLLNLAITFASEGKGRVLVVDGNVMKPGLAMKLGVKARPGLPEVLANRVPLTLAIQPTMMERLDALGAGEATTETALALGKEFPRVLSQLRNWYDWVLVDGGTWGVLPQSDATCPSADAVYLVTRESHVDRPEFAAVRGWVRELGGLLRGYVTTRV